MAKQTEVTVETGDDSSEAKRVHIDSNTDVERLKALLVDSLGLDSFLGLEFADDKGEWRPLESVAQLIPHAPKIRIQVEPTRKPEVAARPPSGPRSFKLLVQCPDGNRRVELAAQNLEDLRSGVHRELGLQQQGFDNVEWMDGSEWKRLGSVDQLPLIAKIRFETRNTSVASRPPRDRPQSRTFTLVVEKEEGLVKQPRVEARTLEELRRNLNLENRDYQFAPQQSNGAAVRWAPLNDINALPEFARIRPVPMTTMTKAAGRTRSPPAASPSGSPTALSLASLSPASFQSSVVSSPASSLMNTPSTSFSLTASPAGVRPIKLGVQARPGMPALAERALKLSPRNATQLNSSQFNELLKYADPAASEASSAQQGDATGGKEEPPRTQSQLSAEPTPRLDKPAPLSISVSQRPRFFVSNGPPHPPKPVRGWSCSWLAIKVQASFFGQEIVVAGRSSGISVYIKGGSVKLPAPTNAFVFLVPSDLPIAVVNDKLSQTHFVGLDQSSCAQLSQSFRRSTR